MYMLYLRIENMPEEVIPIAELTHYKKAPGISINKASNIDIINAFTCSFETKKAFFDYLDSENILANNQILGKKYNFHIKKNGNNYVGDAFFGSEYDLLNWNGLKKWFKANKSNRNAINRIVNSFSSKRERKRRISLIPEESTAFDTVLRLLSDINSLSESMDELNILVNLTYEEILEFALFIRDKIEIVKDEPKTTIKSGQKQIENINSKTLTKDLKDVA